MVIRLFGYIITIEKASSWVQVDAGIVKADKTIAKDVKSKFAGNKRIPGQGITIHTEETEYYRSITDNKCKKITDY
jgi:hypothetical protein